MKIYRIFPEAQAIALGEAAAKLQWSEGKARTAALTGTTKRNQEILSHVSLQTIGKRIAAHPELQLDCIPFKMHPPKYSRYMEGQQYHLHTDAPWMGETRTDLSCTLWLSKDYDGGELVVDGVKYKGQPGECLIYECGKPHEVLPVTFGERICVVTWIQSRIRDAYKRQLVSEMRQFLRKLENPTCSDDYCALKNPELFVQGGRIHSALLRMWTET